MWRKNIIPATDIICTEIELEYCVIFDNPLQHLAQSWVVVNDIHNLLTLI